MSADVGVGELIEELEQRSTRLPFEIGAFVALEACEGLLRRAVKLDPDDVRVTFEGMVVLSQTAPQAESEEAALSLLSILKRLLAAAGPGIPPDLLELVQEREPEEETRGLRELYDAIEASLIPINRGASRRVLARLVRDSDRSAANKIPELDPTELDAELDELLREPEVRTPAPRPAERAPQPAESKRDTERIRFARPSSDVTAEPEPEPEPERVDRNRSDVPEVADIGPAAAPPAEAHPGPSRAAVAMALPEERPSGPPEPITKTIRKWQSSAEPEAQAAVPVAKSVPVTEPELETPSESVFGTGSVTATASRDSRASDPRIERRSSATAESFARSPSAATSAPRRARLAGWGVWLFAAGVGLVIYAGVAAGVFDRWLQPVESAPQAAPAGVIDATVSPADSQIFVYVGRGPAVASGLAVGDPHEFIVFDEGLRPNRAIVPSDAKWTTTASGPLYELAVQTQAAADPSVMLDLGSPETTPGDGGGTQGTVRVITNPPGAKVYRFVGHGPTARIRVRSIHEGQEVLVYRPGHETRRAVIGPSDWEAVEGREERLANLQVQLPASPRSVVSEPTED